MKTIITKDKTHLYFKDWGSGPPVILLHGWPLSSDSWDEIAIEIVDAGYRCIAYDRRGFGRSSQPWTGYDYNTLADDLAAVIEQTGVNNVILIGFSMGGGEIARYLSRHGDELIKKVVLISSVVPFKQITSGKTLNHDQAAFDKMSCLLKENRVDFLTNFFNDFFSIDKIEKVISNEFLEWMHFMSMQASLQATLECARSFTTTDFRDDLMSFTVPTLIIHGTDDLIVPIDVAGRTAAGHIENSILIEYSNAPHGLFATDRDHLVKDLLEFIK